MIQNESVIGIMHILSEASRIRCLRLIGIFSRQDIWCTVIDWISVFL